MAEFTRSDSEPVICEGEPIFSSSLDRFSVSLSSKEGQVTYSMHLRLEEARQLAA
jgi:hypothetical protein